MQYILASGVRVDVKNKFGNTPLHLACLTKNIGAVESLIDQGADVNALNSNGESPIFYALALQEVPRFEGSEEFTDRFDKYSEEGQLEIVIALLAAGANTGITNSGGFTVGDFAVVGSGAHVQELVRAGKHATDSPRIPSRQHVNVFFVKTVWTRLANSMIATGFGCTQAE